jgi:hypothetical protein
VQTSGLPSGTKEAAEKVVIVNQKREKHTSGAEALSDSIGFIPGMNPRPTAPASFSADWKASVYFESFAARLNRLLQNFQLRLK